MAMRKGTNFNHPQKGSHIAVGPIRSLKAIKAIKKLLADKPRDLALFTLAINSNLRASDLLAIRVSQVDHLGAGDELELRERKTGKARRITINGVVHAALETYLSKPPHCDSLNDDDFLFLSKRGGPLTVPSVNALVKSWCKAVGLAGNFGSHTLRKTFGFHQRETFKVDLPELMVVFNHSSQRQTCDYLGIQPEAIRAIYMNEL